MVLYVCVLFFGRSGALVGQAVRLQRFARKRGCPVDEVVMETASGLNGKRCKLLRLLSVYGRRSARRRAERAAAAVERRLEELAVQNGLFCPVEAWRSVPYFWVGKEAEFLAEGSRLAYR